MHVNVQPSLHHGSTCKAACKRNSDCGLAGSTPFHSGGSRQWILEGSDDSDDTDLIESCSPNTVTRRLLGPILMEKIEDMKSGKPDQVSILSPIIRH